MENRKDYDSQINFKVSSELKQLLDQLMAMKTLRDGKKCTQLELLEEALSALASRYREE